MKQKKTYWQCITRNSTGDILTTIWHGTESSISTLIKRYDFINWIEIEQGDTVGEIVDRILGEDHKAEYE